ncbi:MAG: hypothetical protein D6818_06360 [Bacteroidetes bacterium]|nr:MAG: hypothetical protein D6818_06360 [Bacteroidota bacterium]
MDKEKWIEEVLHSMDDAARAQPPADLFARIEARIESEGKVRSLRIGRWQAIAAAVLILLLNVLALRQAMRSNATATDARLYQAHLVNDLKIYE